MDKPNIAVKGIESALKFRRAIKSFDPKKKISDEDIELILEAIRLAPTSYGFEPFNVIVAQVVMLALGYGNKKPHQQTRRMMDEIARWY